MLHLMGLGVRVSALRPLPLGKCRSKTGRIHRRKTSLPRKRVDIGAVNWRYFLRQTVWKHSGRTALSIGEQMYFILLVAWTWQLQRSGVWEFIHKTQSSVSNCGFLSRPPVRCISSFKLFKQSILNILPTPFQKPYFSAIAKGYRWCEKEMDSIPDTRRNFLLSTEFRDDFLICCCSMQRDITVLSLIKLKMLKLQRNFGDL